MIFIVITVVLLISIAPLLIHGKKNINKFMIPFVIMLIGDIFLLSAKYLIRDDFAAFCIYLPAILSLVIGTVWMIVRLVKCLKDDKSKRTIAAIVSVMLVTAIIIPLKPLDYKDKYNIYKNEYTTVADAMFEAYDNGTLKIGDQFASPPYATYQIDEINSDIANDITGSMENLNRFAGVYTYIMADKDVIYFSFGAAFQSIDGIAICRNGKVPSADQELIRRFFDGCTRFTYIDENVYYFNDGL